MSDRPRVARIQDVARAAGVSVATVSLVMNGKTTVAAGTAKRVLEVAEQLDYRPHHAARSLASKRASAVGLLLPSATPVSDAFFATFLAGLVDAFRREDHYLLLLPPSDDAERTATSLVQAVTAKRVDGVIVMEAAQDDARQRILADQGVPTVVFGRSECGLPWVDVDNVLGGTMAARHLVELGHERMAHIAAPSRFVFAHDRRRGFEDEVVRALGPEHAPIVFEAELTSEAACDAAERILQSHAPTAIFAASDLMANGVITCANRLGLSVPGDLSVVGFDDTSLARTGLPALTTLAQNPRSIGTRIAERMLLNLEDGDVGHELIVPSLHVGDSTAPPRIDAP